MPGGCHTPGHITHYPPGWSPQHGWSADESTVGVMSHLSCNSFIKKPTCNKYTPLLLYKQIKEFDKETIKRRAPLDPSKPLLPCVWSRPSPVPSVSMPSSHSVLVSWSCNPPPVVPTLCHISQHYKLPSHPLIGHHS